MIEAEQMLRRQGRSLKNDTYMTRLDTPDDRDPEHFRAPCRGNTCAAVAHGSGKGTQLYARRWRLVKRIDCCKLSRESPITPNPNSIIIHVAASGTAAPVIDTV
jgi:hypothetical protein